MKTPGTPSRGAVSYTHLEGYKRQPYDLMWQDDRFWRPAMLDGKRFEAFFTFEGDRMMEFSLKTGD